MTRIVPYPMLTLDHSYRAFHASGSQRIAIKPAVRSTAKYAQIQQFYKSIWGDRKAVSRA
jgi:hypothetical protein